MEGFRLIERIGLQNLLSFGPEGSDLELEPLNVLIGPNGSGKSNLIAALSLLHAAPSDITVPIREGGGIAEWLWKGPPDSVGAIDVTVLWGDRNGSLRHHLAIEEIDHRAVVAEEEVRDGADPLATRHPGPPAQTRVFWNDQHAGAFVPQDLPERDLPQGRSIFSLSMDRRRFPGLMALRDAYDRMAIHADWRFGPGSAARQFQRADLLPERVVPDGSNVALVLNYLNSLGPPHRKVMELMRRLCDDLDQVSVQVLGGMVQLLFHHTGMDAPVAGSRASDGILRFLTLVCLLCHPDPPPLICIEEPELGLHPDIIRTVAELLVEASQRTQLIVTTHSDLLVSALSDVPEAVVVFERGPNGSEARRLEPDKLREWLKDYSLGDLWASGRLGGNRW